MKKWINGLAALLAGAALLTACSNDEGVVTEQIPAVDAGTIVPNATGSAGESGTTRAYVGTVVTAEGFNLDRVSRVTFTPTAEGAEEIVAEIVEQTIKTLKFKVPTLGFGQRDDSYAANLRVYGDGDAAVFQYLYYVTVPVTDAIVTGYAPEAGTVGTEITISGRNLEQVTEVRFDGHTILSDAFVEVVEGSTTSSVTFAVPVGTYAAGENDVAIEVVWGGSNTIDVTGENPFKMQIAKVEALEPQPEGTSAKIGDELTLTGEFLDLVTNVYWGAYELLITEQSAEQIVVKFPSSIGQAEVRAVADEAVVEADITALYSGFTEPVVLCAGYRVDTTPIGPEKPVFASWTAEDGGDDNKFYLGKTVTVKGENLSTIEGFTVDGVAAELSGTPTDVEAKFIVPEGVTFTEATEVAVKALYNGGEAVDFGQATVYPFYFFKGIKLGLGSNSNKTYTEYAAENAFFVPDMGRVYSTADWKAEQIDPYVFEEGGNPYIKTAATLTDATSEQYYAAKPYIFFIANSTHKLSCNNCSGSASNLKNHFINEGSSDAPKWTALPSTFGTPITTYRVLTDATATKAREGSLTTMTYTSSSLPTANSPALGTSESSSAWTTGSVLAVAYVNHACGKAPSSVDDLARVGYIVIREITCADLETGLAREDREGYIEFDMYWSKMLNE